MKKLTFLFITLCFICTIYAQNFDYVQYQKEKYGYINANCSLTKDSAIIYGEVIMHPAYSIEEYTGESIWDGKKINTCSSFLQDGYGIEYDKKSKIYIIVISGEIELLLYKDSVYYTDGDEIQSFAYKAETITNIVNKINYGN